VTTSKKQKINHFFIFFLFLSLFFGVQKSIAVTNLELENALSQSQWNLAVQIAYELLLKDPKNATAKLKGGYALFQLGYPNAALVFLKKISSEDWASLPQSKDRFVEIAALFQKKVPFQVLPGRLEQISVDQAPAALRDEILFAKGRIAFELENLEESEHILNLISKKSRFYSQAAYLLGSIKVQRKDYTNAALEFSKVFEPTVFEQTTEFWKDLSTQMTTHWGTNLHILLDTELLSQSQTLAELSILALARVAFAQKDYEAAVIQYSKISNTSIFYSKATLEKIWALLSLNNHDQAQKEALVLSIKDTSFEAVEASIVRALVLTDAGKTNEAREELTRFFKIYDITKKNLERNYSPPAFLAQDYRQNRILQNLKQYQTQIKQEKTVLLKQEQNLYPVFLYLSSELDALFVESQTQIQKIEHTHNTARLLDLEKLYVQAKLILAETFLEDREKLRAAFKGVTEFDVNKQKEHDEKLIYNLSNAIKTSNEARARLKKRHLLLDFRHTELLWELSTAFAVSSQTTKDLKMHAQANSLKQEALKEVSEITENHPQFSKKGDALFFKGFIHIELGQKTEGIKTLVQYVKQYPKHKQVPEAYRILGDFKFDENRFSEAATYYGEILKFQDAPVVGYAFYKAGWCAYNLRNHAKALLSLEKAIQWVSTKSTETQLINLKNEAQNDLVAIYAEVGDHKKAHEYFKQFFQKDIQEWLEHLAIRLEKMGQFEKTSDLYKMLIYLNPSSNNKHMVFRAAILYGAYKLHRWKEVYDEAKTLTEQFGSVLANPTQLNENSVAYVEKTLRETVLAQHFEFKKSDNASILEQILLLDKLYLETFERWPSSQEPLYRHALFLMKQKKYLEAAEAFEKHWRNFNVILKEPLREESLRNLIHSLETDETFQKEKIDQMTKTAQKILKYSEEYIKNYGHSVHVRAIAFLRTSIFFKYKELENGISESQKLFDVNPSDEFSKKAFKNLRVAYYDLKDWKRTYEWASHVIQRNSTTAHHSDLFSVQEESLFLLAENTKDHQEAANLFLKITSFPTMARLHAKAYYNAFIRFNKINEKLKALDIATKLEELSPNFESLPEIAGIRAAYYQEAGDYLKAKHFLEIFLKGYARDVQVLKQAKLNLELITKALNMEKQEQNLNLPSFAQWTSLLKTKENYEKNILPKKGSLVTRIKSGGENLEKVTQQFLSTATNQRTPTYYAYESFCVLPFLYTQYSDAVLPLENGDEELQKELIKITQPIQNKANELATQCIEQSEKQEHVGPFYFKVLVKWGWKSDTNFKEKSQKLLTQLEQKSPWLEPLESPTTETEKNILRHHLENGGDEESWYALAYTRFHKKQIGLAKLTLADAINKKMRTGKIINLLGALELNQNKKKFFEEASHLNSAAALVNLGIYHLQGGRKNLAQSNFKKALEKDVFNSNKNLKQLVKAFIND